MAPLLHGLSYQRAIPTAASNSPMVQPVECNARQAKSPSEATCDPTSPKAFSHGAEKLVQLPERDCKTYPSLNPTGSTEAPKAHMEKPSRLRKSLGGTSPFPHHAGPSTAECQMVHRILSDKHAKIEMPENVPPPSQSIAGCGEVNFVLEALIRTLISTHTHMSNADKAIQNVCSKYPVFQNGDFAGSVDWNIVRLRGVDQLAQAIRPAGKSQVTSRAIIAILESVKIENDEKREHIITGAVPQQLQKPGQLSRAEILGRRAYEVLENDPEFLTLDYLHLEPPSVVFERLQQFHGVGVKSAACILLFCFQYPAFAVDTHVWRLCKFLGWVPTNASRDETFFHLDPIIPNELKYGLHQLFIAHGKDCRRCNMKGYSTDKVQDDAECVIEHLVCRSIDSKQPKGRNKTAVRGRSNGKIAVSSNTRNLDETKNDTDMLKKVAPGKLQGSNKEMALRSKETSLGPKLKESNKRIPTCAPESTTLPSDMARKKRKAATSFPMSIVTGPKRSRRNMVQSVVEN